MIVVVDTNVLLSAALRDRLPEQVVLYVAMRDDWKWIVTPPDYGRIRRGIAPAQIPPFARNA
jgi:hypothetical protein